jgi:hypothetical protein
MSSLTENTEEIQKIDKVQQKLDKNKIEIERVLDKLKILEIYSHGNIQTMSKVNTLDR